MKFVMVLFLTMVGGIGPWSSASASTPVAGVAVVELFTSEGCSSCPPAERVLGELARDAQRDGRPVLTLAFHVDYWNTAGWADRFSDPAFSRRQEQYAKSLNLSDIYTPQMVVNGTVQFVGSDRKAADEAIADALAKAQSSPVALKVSRGERDAYTVHITAKGDDPGTVVNVAVVEQGLSTKVKSGENAGRQLEEPSVVRWFKSVPLSEATDVAVPSLPEVKVQNASVFVYVQRPANGMVLGAATASLPEQ